MEKMNLILMKLDEMNGKIDRLGERMDRLEERMDRLEERMDRLEERVIQLELKAVEQERWNRKIEAQITKIEMSIENELLYGINAIGDGHIDLGRKLDNAVESAAWREHVQIRLLYFESEIRRIKENCKKCA